MLTEGAQSWRIEDESTWAPSINIEVEYLELSEYDEIEWPDSPTFFVVNKPWHVDYKPVWTAQTLTFSSDFLLMVTYNATLAYAHV